MTSPRSEEQLLREWMTETVWLPDSDLSGVQARIHRTPQHRGLVPPFDSGGIVRMFSATRIVVAGLVLALFGGFLMFGPLPGGGETSPAPAGVSATSDPAATQLDVVTPEPDPTELALDTPADPTSPPRTSAKRRKNVHWEDGGITFEADDFTIDAFGRTFKPQTLKWLDNRYRDARLDGTPREAIIEGHWKDDGTAMRLRLVLRSDGEHWWIVNAFTLGDADEEKNLLWYLPLKDQTRTKVGEVMKATIDMARPGKDIRLRIDGMRIDAFRPGTIPEWSPEPKNPRLKLEVESKTMLPGQRQRMTAEWCHEDDCWPATDVRWSSDDPDVIDFAPSTGAWTEVTALKPGLGRITGRKGQQFRKHAFWVYPRPSGGDVPEDMDPRGVDLATPATETLKVGQHVIVTGWRCPTAKANQLGPDRRPGTDDDDCETAKIAGVRSIGESTLSRIELVGPSALLRVDGFNGLGGPVAPSPVQVTFPGRSVVQIGTSNLYLRDAPWTGPLLGDLDVDGSVDSADIALLLDAIGTKGRDIGPDDDAWSPALDLNSDERIDDVDLALLNALAASHAGEADEVPVTPRWPRDEETPTVAEATSAMTVAAGGLNSPRTAAKPERVHWSDRGVTFDARDFTITTRYGTFKPKTPHSVFGYHDFYSTTDNGVPREAELEADWKQDGAWMRLRFELRSDGEDWWIHRIRTYDGHPTDGQYLNYPNLKEKTLTKMGEAFEGSLNIRPTKSERMSSVPGARLVIKDMHLEAYDLEAIPTPEPRVERPRLIIENELSALLAGQSMKVTAKWCLQDDCWPATDARWSTDRPDSTKIDPERGSWTRVTALKPGEASIQADAHQIGYAGGVLIHPRPGKGTDEQRYGKRKHAKNVVVTPRDQVLKLGQYAVLTGWRCPTKGPGQLGPDGEAGTKDDECVTEAPASWRPLPNSGIAMVDEVGPSALILAASFELEGDDLMYAPVFARFEGHDISEPNLYIRDAVARGPLLGDLDASDAVDADDLALLAAVLDEHGDGVERNADGWDAALDLNHDGRVDDVDQDLLAALVGAHAGTIEPVPAQPFATMPPDVGHAP